MKFRLTAALLPSGVCLNRVVMQVPIQVNKYLAYSDGMRVVESGKSTAQAPGSDGLLFTELDRSFVLAIIVDRLMF